MQPIYYKQWSLKHFVFHRANAHIQNNTFRIHCWNDSYSLLKSIQAIYAMNCNGVEELNLELTDFKKAAL